MQKVNKIFSTTNLMILAGLALIVFGVGSILKDIDQDNSVTVLVSGNAGDLGGDPFAFRPPLQVEVTRQPVAVDNKDPKTGSVESPMVLGKIPDRLKIDSIQLDAPVLPEHYKQIHLGDQVFIQWRVPFRRASGWHDTSALLGEIGNTVLNGHHNAYGEVFKELINLKEEDLIEVYSDGIVFTYKVNTILLIPEKYQSMDDRINNASWIMPTTDERLTLVTCWPPESNTHRLIVVAFPVKDVPPSAQ